MVDDDILGFDVAMHDADGVGIVKTLQNLVDVVFAILRGQHFIEFSIFYVFDVLEHQAKNIPLAHDVQQFDRIMLPVQSHQDLYFPIDFLKFD